MLRNENDAGRMHYPLLVGCSGGGGHNAAIMAIKEYLQEKSVIHDDAHLAKHQAGLPDDKGRMGSKEQRQINIATALNSDTPGIRNITRWGLKKTSLPILPKKLTLEKEVDALRKSQTEEVQNQSGGTITRAKQRLYVDMLLDVYPAGYQNAGIWNALQKSDETRELNKLIAKKNYSDKRNYQVVYKHFLQVLESAYQSKTPYTEIISTQAMGFPALCDAVIEYNERHANDDAPVVKIHQYMTDIATAGAVHFFDSLSHLNEKQRQQILLYGVHLNQQMVRQFLLDNPPFAEIVNLDPKNNPIVRKGFKGEITETPIHINAKMGVKNEYDIQSTEKVAAIMLGSQASIDTVAYVKKLAKHFDRIFIFGGNTQHIIKKLQPLIEQFGPEKIIALDNQDDIHIAPIMKRSDLILMRGGGLSVMEQMALPHNEGQVIFIHTKDEKGKLTSGISWEDANVDELTDYLGKQNIPVLRTTTEKIEAQLLAWQKREKAAPENFSGRMSQSREMLMGAYRGSPRTSDIENTANEIKKIPDLASTITETTQRIASMIRYIEQHHRLYLEQNAYQENDEGKDLIGTKESIMNSLEEIIKGLPDNKETKKRFELFATLCRNVMDQFIAEKNRALNTNKKSDVTLGWLPSNKRD